MIQSLAITLLVTLVILSPRLLALAVERDEPNLEG
jgi:hypothetical protein